MGTWNLGEKASWQERLALMKVCYTLLNIKQLILLNVAYPTFYLAYYYTYTMLGLTGIQWQSWRGKWKNEEKTDRGWDGTEIHKYTKARIRQTGFSARETIAPRELSTFVIHSWGDKGLVHTADKGVELIHTDNQAGSISSVLLDQEHSLS